MQRNAVLAIVRTVKQAKRSAPLRDHLVDTPLDRTASFEPELIHKIETILAESQEAKILVWMAWE